jgi:anti-sigma regulatory factor (Ser/Thr protein kinase)
MVTWEHRLTASIDSIREARRHVRAALSAHTDTDTLERTELVVSELVTNSVRYGPGQRITLRLSTRNDGGVVGAVEDQGQGVVAIRKQEVGAIGGLGLRVVDSLTSGWGVDPGTTHVWFRVDP